MPLYIFLFIHTFFSPVISSNIHRYFNNILHEFKVLKKVIITEAFNVDFHNKFMKFGLFYFCYFSSHTHIYIYIYIYIYIWSGDAWEWLKWGNQAESRIEVWKGFKSGNAEGFAEREINPECSWQKKKNDSHSYHTISINTIKTETKRERICKK